MAVWGHKVPEYHREIFGDDEPRSMYFIIMTIADYWEMHPLRPEFSTLYAVAPQEIKDRFSRYIQQVPVTRCPDKRFYCGVPGSVEDIAPGCHFIPGFHKSAGLVRALKANGMTIPPVVYFGKDLPKNQWENGYVYEGKHRFGAAGILGWPTVPALVLHTVAALNGYCGMTDDEREILKQEQAKRDLPDSSRIHGVTIPFWTEQELRTFMRPRPNNPLQYYMQNKLPTIRGCARGHPDWKDVPRGVVIRKKGGDIPLPWDTTESLR
jgi:hypothetical protein